MVQHGLCSIIVSLLVTSAACAAGRPNIVFFLVDDLGRMDIGAYNAETFYETPHVDRLAAEGMLFTQGYAACPVCSPTRYSILTGKYPTRAGLTNWLVGEREGRFAPAPLRDHMPLEEVTLAESLRAAGYRTAFLGKWHLGPTEEFWPEGQGFEFNIGGTDRGSPRSYFSPYNNPRLADGPAGEHLPERLANEACAIIEQLKDEPFLLYFSFYSVHTPLQAREDLITRYRAKAAELGAPPEFTEEEQVWPTDEPRKVRAVQNHAVYAAMMESMDAAVGQVLSKLDELGLADNTVVCFTSDNGGLSTSEGSPTSNLPFRGGKGWLYEGGIREPYLIKWPGATEPGSTCDVPVCSIDFLPTLLEIAGATAHAGDVVDGRSLVPLLKSGGADEAHGWKERPLFWHYPHYSNQGGFPGGAIRVGDWKLIERYEDGRVHLFNMAEDPVEQRDVADAQPAVVEALRNQLHAWYGDVGAQFLQEKDGREPWRP
jgi:arylsulfatase A-like enzyme